jgi:hypothetical protein
MLDIDKYFDTVVLDTPTHNKITRTAARGMSYFYVDLFKEIQQHREVTSLLELGISGGASHEKWAAGVTIEDGKHTCDIYGIDILDWEQSDFSKNPSYAGFQEQALRTQHEWPFIKYMWGTSAYDAETPVKAISEWNTSGFDIVVDDAATDWPRMKYSLPVWKDYVNMCYISEVPDGMGVQSFWDMTREEHLNNFNELADFGLVVLDLEPYKNIPQGFEQAYNAHFMGWWMPDWSIARNTIEKYRDCIIAGGHNIG